MRSFQSSLHLLAGTVLRRLPDLGALDRRGPGGVAHHENLLLSAVGEAAGHAAAQLAGRPGHCHRHGCQATRAMPDLVVAQDLRVLGRPGPAGSGIGRYVECLNEALTERASDLGLRIEEITEPQRWEPLEHVFQGRAVKRLGADVLHTPSLDFLSLRPGAPLVVTLHDLAPLKNPEVYLRTGLLHKLRYRAVRRARRVMVHSHAVAADAERMLGIDPDRIVVVPSAVPPGFAPVEDARARLSHLGLPAHYLLWVGSLDPIDPRKGVEPLVDAVAGWRRPAAGAGRGGVPRRG